MMILRCTSSHTRSSLCVPIKTTQMLLPSRIEKTLLLRLLSCFCVCVVEKTSSSSTTNEDPFQSLSLITSTFFPCKRKTAQMYLGFYWYPKWIFLSLSLYQFSLLLRKQERTLFYLSVLTLHIEFPLKAFLLRFKTPLKRETSRSRLFYSRAFFFSQIV